jgi:hypothetical protein
MHAYDVWKVKTLTLYACIREVSGSNLEEVVLLTILVHWFISISSSECWNGIFIKGHNRFFLNLFPHNIHNNFFTILDTAWIMNVPEIRKVKLSMCLIIYARHEHVCRRGSRAPLFLTSALDGEKWPASLPSRFIPGEGAPVPTGQKTGWTPEPVWTPWNTKKNLLPLPVIKPRPSRP